LGTVVVSRKKEVKRGKKRKRTEMGGGPTAKHSKCEACNWGKPDTSIGDKQMGYKGVRRQREKGRLILVKITRGV